MFLVRTVKALFLVPSLQFRRSERPQPVKSGGAGTGATRSAASMARTCLLTGEDAEIGSMQGGRKLQRAALSTYPCDNYRKPIGF
jgi:hypothetical protein